VGTMKTAVTPFYLVDRYQRFGEIACLHLREYSTRKNEALGSSEV
jgi:hypothetical protein